MSIEKITSKDRYDKATEKAREIIAQMDITEKIGQLSQFGRSIYTTNEELYTDHLKEGKLGSYLTIMGAKLTNRLQKESIEQSRLHIPVLFANDVIHGYRTTFPTPLTLSFSWEPELARQGAEAAAMEAYRGGTKWTFAPMVDIARDPRWGRIMEGYGEDTYLCCRFAEAAISGFQGDYIGQKDHIIACTKHFVAYGACIGGRDYNSVDMSLQTLHDVYLPSFKAGIDAGVFSVMTSFNDLNGVPTTANTYLLQDVLRDMYGFDGVVISDASGVIELVPQGYSETPQDAAVKAFSAGTDIIMAGDLYNDSLPEAVRSGNISMEAIDEAVMKVLRVKLLLGLFDEPYVDEDKELDGSFSPEHLHISKNSAMRSIVLLENSGVLPINKDKTKLIAVTGPIADNNSDILGNWASLGDVSHTVTILKGISDQAETVYANGCDILGSDRSLFDEHIAQCAKADIIIACVGENRDMSGEASSRSDLSLPGVQEEYVLRLINESSKPVVVLVSAGRPLLLSAISSALKEKGGAMLFIGQGGTEAGNAVADVLFGRYNPSGRLTVTFPYSVGQLPVYYNKLSTGKPALGNYRFEAKYQDAPIEGLYCFGYGLSYTEFRYTDITLSTSTLKQDDTLTISFTVSNVGEYDGETVAELYIRDLFGCRVRPIRELKGFEKVFVAKSESKRVSLELPMSRLAFFDSRMNKIVEPGEFKLWVGANCLDDKLCANFRIIE